MKAVCWTSDDFRLVSTGQDGATYEYDILKEGRRVSAAGRFKTPHEIKRYIIYIYIRT